MKHFRMLAAGLCSAVLLCGFAIPAYAYSDSGNEEPPVVEETPAPEPAPTITPGVSHCGIYVGDGRMLHCGDPIGYANLNTSYWQSHFYAYGRLP